jgi:hypothetical protein
MNRAGNSGVVAPVTASLSALALALALLVAGAGSSCAATKSTAKKAPSATTKKGTTKGTGKPLATGPVTISFDSPGTTPRALKETTVEVPSVVKVLEMQIENVSYPGATCGFSFRGTRPASPVTVRIWGATGEGNQAVAFDSGELAITWEPEGTGAKDADSGSDKASGWNFLADAVPNRNGPGWVVQAAGVPQKKQKPTTLRCSLTSAAGIGPANGPIGYWAGFATI